MAKQSFPENDPIEIGQSNKEAVDVTIDYLQTKQAPKPFPYIPPAPTEREMTRMELMFQLNMWDNNNTTIAKRHAETMIALLQDQFDIK